MTDDPMFRAGLEAAAKVADRVAKECGADLRALKKAGDDLPGECRASGGQIEALRIAKAVRALATQPASADPVAGDDEARARDVLASVCDDRSQWEGKAVRRWDKDDLPTVPAETAIAAMLAFARTRPSAASESGTTAHEGLSSAIEAIHAAEAALCRSSRYLPDVGSDPIRAVVDVERGNLRRSRQHLLSARAALSPHSDMGGVG